MKKTFLNFVKSMGLASLISAAPLWALEQETDALRSYCMSRSAHPFIRDPLSREFQSVLQKFRESVREHQDNGRFFLAQPSCEFLPLLDGLMEYVGSLAESSEKNFLMVSLEAHKKIGSITPGILLGSYFKAAHLRGAPSDNEKSIFKYVVQSADEVTKELVLGLSDPQGWEYRLVSFFSERLFSEDNASISLRNANYQIIELIQIALTKSFPTPFFYPVVREKKFPIEFMIACNLENVFPIAFGQKIIKAHGENFSGVGLALHDLLHGLGTSAYGALKAHIVKKTDAIVDLKEDARGFIESYVPSAVSKYGKIMQDLKRVYLSLKDLTEGEKRPALAGFFWMLHEASSFQAKRVVDGVSEDIFEVDSFKDILNMLVEESKIIVNEEESWESPIDHFRTNPLTGESCFLDEDLVASALEDLPPENKLNTNITLEKNRRFIKFIYLNLNGSTGFSIWTTLAHKWDNVDDSLAILKYAGKKIEKPDLMSLENPDEQRSLAMDFLRTVQQELCGLLDNFREKTLSLF